MVQVTWCDIAGVIAYLKALRSDGFYYSVCWNLPMIEKLSLPNFICFILVSYLQDQPLHKNQAAKFPTILDNFLLSVDCMGEARKMVVLNFKREKSSIFI